MVIMVPTSEIILMMGLFIEMMKTLNKNFSFFNDNESHLYKLGVDIHLNEKNTISFFTNQNYFNGAGMGNTDISYFSDNTRI